MNKQGGVKRRRENVIERLQVQLKSNHKPAQTEIDGKVVDGLIELSEHDVKRVNREIEVLKERIR